MNKLTIYTRSYIRDDGTWNLEDHTIQSMVRLIQLVETYNPGWLDWVILVSNTQIINLNKLRRELYIKTAEVCEQIELIEILPKYSSSEARKYLLSEFLRRNNFGYSYSDFYMNLDSDDEVINHSIFLDIINSDKLEDDLVGFGLEFNQPTDLEVDWTFTLEKFIKSRRYITTETQAMFLFLYNIKVIDYILNKGEYFKTRPADSKYELPEDTLMNLDISQANNSSEMKFKVGAICGNLIKYYIHSNQISRTQSPDERLDLQKKLKELGYLYVNSGNFYMPTEYKPKLDKFNPYELNKD